MKLYTFCGIDGSGKDSIINFVYEVLKRKYDVIKIRQPSEKGKAELLNNLNSEKLQLLGLAYDYQQQVESVIKPLEKTNTIILCSRWFPVCSQVYQGDIAREYIKLVDIIEPEITFYVKCPVSQAYLRNNQNADNIDIDFGKQSLVAQRYENFFESTLLNTVTVDNHDKNFDQAVTTVIKKIDSSNVRIG